MLENLLISYLSQRLQRLNGHITVDDPNDRDRWTRIKFYSSDRGHRSAFLNDQNDDHISQCALHFRFISVHSTKMADSNRNESLADGNESEVFVLTKTS